MVEVDVVIVVVVDVIAAVVVVAVRRSVVGRRRRRSRVRASIDAVLTLVHVLATIVIQPLLLLTTAAAVVAVVVAVGGGALLLDYLETMQEVALHLAERKGRSRDVYRAGAGGGTAGGGAGSRMERWFGGRKGAGVMWLGHGIAVSGWWH